MDFSTSYLVISLVAFGASLLTLFSGFGLGTLLLPAFLLFFPLEIAIALTAIVHLANNLFKLALFYPFINSHILKRFGIPSVLAAFIGAWCLSLLSNVPHLGAISLLGKTFLLSPLKMLIGCLVMAFALIDLVPKWANTTFPAKYLPLGGAISGFFGGISGHQGMLRTAFLVKSNLEKETFIGTGVSVACLVDVTRLSMYAQHLTTASLSLHWELLCVAVLSAFAGAYWGSKWLQKVMLTWLQRIVGISLVLFGALMTLGVV